LERQFDARETEKVIKPVDGLERHAKGSTPSSERARYSIVLRSWHGGTEDRVDDRGSTTEGKA